MPAISPAVCNIEWPADFNASPTMACTDGSRHAIPWCSEMPTSSKPCPTERRNPVARALRTVKPKVVRSRVKYTRKTKHKAHRHGAAAGVSQGEFVQSRLLSPTSL